MEGNFRVKGNGEFRAVGQGETSDPLTNGQINVIGDVISQKKVIGEMKFTFGKTGCDSDKVPFIATK